MALLNYTTRIDPDKTAAEIAKILSMHGATAVMTEYDKEDGAVTALSFKVQLNDKQLGFRLPCSWEPVLRVLTEQWRAGKLKQNGSKAPDRLQAVRVAWRIVKDWVEAQMALVETQMVETHDVFLPYLVLPNDKTLAENLKTNPNFLLGDGK